MNLKNNKLIKVSALATILSVGVLTLGYSVLNKDVVLTVRGEKKSISTFKTNVKDLLKDQNIKYDGNDIINLALDTRLSDGMEIEVIDVKEETIKESKEVPFEVKVIEDKDLLKGTTKVENEGKAGKNELVYKITYHNGKKVEKKFVEEIVSTAPESKIVKKGTKVEVKIASSRGESTRGTANATSTSVSNSSNTNSNSNKGRYMKVVATAYTGDGITSTGTKPKWGTIAVDPSVIPYGTKVYIPQFNKTFIAEDCGGAIKGNKIDIFMNDSSSVSNWGIKKIDIYIVG